MTRIAPRRLRFATILALVSASLPLGAVPAAATHGSAFHAVSLDGSDHVSVGPDLLPGSVATGPTSFTIEAWFKKTGTGATTSTSGVAGGGLLSAIPLVTKGRGEGDGSVADVNYFLGIEGGVIGADYEEGTGQVNAGLNHRVVGSTPIQSQVWYHAAATFDGTVFRVYLNGVLEGEVTGLDGRLPQSRSTQHAAIGTAMTSDGVARGRFVGLIDEARVWDHARTQAEIRDTLDQEIAAQPGLIARWGFDEGAGTTADNTGSGGVDGSLASGATWAPGQPFAATLPGPANRSLSLGGVESYVDLGRPAALGLSSFTLEAWVKKAATGGTSTNTGTGGVIAQPVIAKGAGEADGSAVDLNYFLGIDASGAPVADFEDGATGANHPVIGGTTIAAGEWHHVAATYGSASGDWRLYLDGVPVGSATVTAGDQRTPRADSLHNTSIGTAMDSVGLRQGTFAGAIDEVRIWDHARTASDIAASFDARIAVASGLVGSWTMDEGDGLTVGDSAGDGHDGVLYNGTWTEGFSLPPAPNDPPVISGQVPADGAESVSTPPTLSVDVTDPDGDPVDVTFYGRPLVGASTQPFTYVTLPDTQHYVDSSSLEYQFGEQTRWIVANRTTLNVRFVSHLGDIVQNKDTYPQQWIYADSHLAVLDDADIPNNLAPGNHDQGVSGVATSYDRYFPPSRYQGDRSFYDDHEWYGGYQGDGIDPDAADDGIPDGQNRLNKNNYELFSAAGMDFIVIHLEYDMPDYAVAWADRVLEAYPDRHAIISTHLFLTTSNERPTTVLNRTDGTSAQAVWDTLVTQNCNVFLIVNGHYSGEGRRTDPHPGTGCGAHPVHQVVMDYQSRANGGDGWLRYFVFEPDEDEIEAFTYSPTRNGGAGEFETDASSRFTLSWDMAGNAFEQIGNIQTVPSGAGSASVSWSGVSASTAYEWYAVADDGARSSTGSTRSFTTAAASTNDPPVATDDLYSTPEDTALSVDAATGVLDDDTDPDGDPMTVVVGSMPAEGSVDLNTDGSFDYTPNQNFHGTDSFTYTVSDGSTTDEGTVAIIVDPVNDAPSVSSIDPQTIAEDGATAPIAFTVDDLETDAGELVVTAASSVDAVVPDANVVLSGTGTSRSVVVTPAPNTTGSTTITVIVSDGELETLEDFPVTVTEANDPPVVTGGQVSTDEDASVPIALTGIDPEGADLTFSIVDAPDHGTYLGGTYTPAQDYHGTDAFTFVANDGTSDSDPATVEITVSPVNDAPVADDRSVSTSEDTPKAIVLTASDVDGDGLVFTVVDPPTHGTLSGTAPDLTYTPSADYRGQDAFTFTADDGTQSAAGTVSISVSPVNDPPTAASASLTTDEDVSLSITLIANDVDGDALTYVLVSGPSHGTLQGDGADRVYVPAPDHSGPDSFTFHADDGSAVSTLATVTIDVTPIDDAPSISSIDDVVIEEDTSSGSIPFSVADVETDASALVVTATSANPGLIPDGNLVLGGAAAARTITATPVANASGTARITVHVTDGTLSSTEVLDVTVRSVNDAPTAQGAALATPEGSPLTFVLVGADVDEDPLTFVVSSLPANGALFEGTGTEGPQITSAPFPVSGATLTFAPDAGFSGTDVIAFVANDGAMDSVPAAVAITVGDPAPVVSSFTPAKGRPGSTLTISGSRLSGTTSVTFTGLTGPVPAPWISVLGDGTLEVQVPGGAADGPITGPVFVTTPHGTASTPTAFGVVPRIDSISPKAGPVGTLVTITGLAVGDSVIPIVTFGGVRATVVTVMGWDTITAEVPIGARNGKIAVSTLGGTAKSSQTFSVR